ncbi:hypothetical protein CLV98_1363 [Dyadobacter jejuensis]|uniref:TET-Associated Glycosyltransferase domain-containing protein n=1 Tax=Dyadobacter jejuensis TaxID=1082580 RepID=A0A316A2L0_9BACT|nr:hypothetical protein [Dyadobacter jejuensis]PWJ51833.1 hypothetical protein CLV98_1363 [Dyadobacter jejuensis]
MKDIKIIIPSHKRASRVRTTSAVYGATLCVEESQADIYRKCNPGIEIITHPDSVVGLSRKRDWIIKNVGSCFMLDDDIDHLGRIYTEKGEESHVDPATAYDIIQSTAYAAQQAGAFLFGYSSSPTPISYNSLNPIQMSGYVTGCAHGVLEGSKLWYNPDIICNEDYWISLLNAHHHRYIWKDTRYYWAQKDTFVNRGGLAEFRNIEAEEKDFKLLQKVFGQVVELRKSGGTSNLKHPFQKSLKLPF